MKREVTPTENAILDMLHQVAANQEAAMEATARHSLEKAFEVEAEATFEGILIADTIKMRDQIQEAFHPTELTLGKHEVRRRERTERIRQQLERKRWRREGYPNVGHLFAASSLRRHLYRRRDYLLHTPVLLKTYPETVDVDDSKAEVRVSFGWIFQVDKRPGIGVKINIFKATRDEFANKQTNEMIYGIRVAEDAGQQKLNLVSPETTAYLKAAKIDERAVSFPDEFYYQPIGLLEQGMAELATMKWNPRDSRFLVVE